MRIGESTFDDAGYYTGPLPLPAAMLARPKPGRRNFASGWPSWPWLPAPLLLRRLLRRRGRGRMGHITRNRGDRAPRRCGVLHVGERGTRSTHAPWVPQAVKIAPERLSCIEGTRSLLKQDGQRPRLLATTAPRGADSSGVKSGRLSCTCRLRLKIDLDELLPF